MRDLSSTPKAPVLITHVELSKWSISGLITHAFRAKRAISTGALGLKKRSLIDP